MTTSYYDPRTRDPSISRRPGNRRDDEWIRALLARVRVGRISSVWVGEDGEAFPFVTPLAFAYRPDSHDIVYHTNIAGRLRANTEQGSIGQGAPTPTRATFEASELGALLPSNDPLELSVQYRSVIAFGTARVLTDQAEARAALTVMSERVFPGLEIGRDTRPISEDDLARTAVYSLSITQWSGKENWQPAAAQTADWPALSPGLARLNPAQD